MAALAHTARWMVVVAVLAPLPVHAFSDPTQPPDFVPRATHAVSRKAPAAPVLQSTLVSPYRRLAVVSGKQVQVGDRFNGAVVTEITQYEVRMRKHGHEIRLRLLPRLTDKNIEAVK